MLHVIDAGLLPYRPAWDLQLQLHEQVLAGTHPAGALILLEHPPVITIGRRADAQKNLLASPRLLQNRGVELVETDRGGDITFHGPGQLVAYPIIPLNSYNFNLHSYMRFLEEAVIQTLAAFHLPATRDPSPTPATGVWVNTSSTQSAQAQGLQSLGLSEPASKPPPNSDNLAKICALGIKVRRWVTLHGIALNVSTDLSFFDLINPCGLSRPVTSMQKLLAEKTPPMTAVKTTFTTVLSRLLQETKTPG